MAIIISSNGGKAVKVEKSSFDKEDHLQRYIYENPESIPLYEIKEDIQLLILAREFPTNSGPIDAIGVDQYGELYIIETKLYKNSDKRTVIAQALDYGAALWKHSNNFDEFLGELDGHTIETFGLRTTDKIKEFFQLSDEDVTATINKARINLNNGVFHFVVLMDKLDDRLKDLILYVNQNSQFDIYAVELEYYKHDTYEIIIPKIFGTEVKKDFDVSTSSSSRQPWNEEKLFAQAKELLEDDVYQNFKKIYEFSQTHADNVRFGTGQTGSFNPIWYSIRDKSLFTLPSNGRLAINFHWLINEGKSNIETINTFKRKLEEIGFDIPDNYEQVCLRYDPEVWIPKTEAFLKVVEEITKGVG
jgi:hypothetical protein